MDVCELQPSDSPVRDDHVEFYYRKMCQLWGLEPRPTMFNPCALAVSLEKKHLSSACANEYLVTPKIDGLRYLLMLTMSPSEECMAIMIGRDMAMYEVQAWAPHSFFVQGVLVDGELAWARGETRMTYHVFDAMCVEGTNVCRKNLLDRLQVIHTTFSMCDNHINSIERYICTRDDTHLAFVSEECKVVATENNNWGLTFYPKQMSSVSEWSRKVHGRGQPWSIDSECDGIVLTPLKTPVYVGTHRSMFKWKPIECQTVDILFRSNTLYLTDSQGDVQPATEIDGYALVCRHNALDDAVYECQVTVQEVDHTLSVEPKRRRRDKQVPNNIATACGVVNSIIDNITEANLLEWADTPLRSERV